MSLGVLVTLVGIAAWFCGYRHCRRNLRNEVARAIVERERDFVDALRYPAGSCSSERIA